MSSRFPALWLVLICSFGAHGAIITSFGEDLNGDPLSRISFPNATTARTSFLNQIGASSTNNLEGLTSGVLLPLTLNFAAGPSAMVSGGNGAVRSVPVGTDGFGEYPTSGNIYIASDPNVSLVLVFASPISSFGFTGTDLGDFNGGSNLVLTFTGNGPAVTQTVNNTLSSGNRSPASGSVLFFGYSNTTNPFTSVQITSVNDNFGFDDPVIGISTSSTVPEPSTLLLSGAILLFFVWSGKTAFRSEILLSNQG